MASNVCFSDVCGDNVVVSPDGSKATWNTTYSGGTAFSKSTIDKEIKMDLDGSSHVGIGFVEVNPQDLRDRIREATFNDTIKTVCTLRVHKKVVNVKVKRGNGVVIVEQDGEQYTHPFISDSVWMAINVKFGSVLVSTAGSFHEVTGENVEFVGENRNKFKLKIENPAAICCIKQNQGLGEGVSITFNIEPVRDNRGNPPRIYHAKLGLTRVSPTQRKDLDPQSLSIARSKRDASRWTEIALFERKTYPNGKTLDACAGSLLLEVTAKGEIRYNHEKELKAIVNVDVRPLYFVFDLFRVTMKIVSVKKPSTYDYAGADYAEYHRMVPEISPPTDEFVEIYAVDKVEDDTGYISPRRTTADNAGIPDENPYSMAWVVSKLKDVDTAQHGDERERNQVISDVTSEFKTALDFSRNSGVSRNKEDGDSSLAAGITSGISMADTSSKIYRSKSYNPPREGMGAVSSPHAKLKATKSSPDFLTRQHSGNINPNVDQILRRFSSVVDERHSSNRELYELASLLLHNLGPPLVAGQTSSDTDNAVKPQWTDHKREPETTDRKCLAETIRANFPKLVKGIEAFPLCDHLFQHHILSEEDYNNLRKLTENKARHFVNRELLSLLSKHEVKTTDLKKALLETSQGHLVGYFND